MELIDVFLSGAELVPMIIKVRLNGAFSHHYDRWLEIVRKLCCSEYTHARSEWGLWEPREVSHLCADSDL